MSLFASEENGERWKLSTVPRGLGGVCGWQSLIKSGLVGHGFDWQTPVSPLPPLPLCQATHLSLLCSIFALFWFYS